jgi:hypothetical protein
MQRDTTRTATTALPAATRATPDTTAPRASAWRDEQRPQREIYGFDHLAPVDPGGNTGTVSVGQLVQFRAPECGPRIGEGRLLDHNGETFAIGDIHYAAARSAYPYLFVRHLDPVSSDETPLIRQFEFVASVVLSSAF